ncbi:MAG: tetratricopeptide repeat protein [Pseudomonadota bacterium]
MPLLAIVSLIFEVLLIVHVIKTGRNTIWIWVLVLLPGAGIIAYVAAELLPDLLRSRATKRTVKGMKRALDPEVDLRRLAQNAEISGGVDASQRHAEELLRLGRPAEAIPVYQRILRGLYEHDPNLMLGLARAQFAAGNASDARVTLDTLMQHNPEFRSADGHLLYARALEMEGLAERAMDEYKVLTGYYPGAEARVRYAQLLRAQNEPDQAKKQLRDLLNQAAIAPPHYRRSQEDWLKQAEREIAAL